MEHIHGVGSVGFCGDFDQDQLLPFGQRKDKFVWRGGMNGLTRPDVSGRHAPRVSAQFLLARKKSGMTDEMLHEQLRLVPRYGFVSSVKNHDLADVGLTTVHKNAFLSPYLAPGLTQREMAAYRYIVVLPGADLPTSFFWSLASGSLCLVMEHEWESFASCHFRPWEHFVPFAQDMSNFDERLAWARSNQKEAEAMTVAARKAMAIINQSKYRSDSNRMLVDALRARMGVARRPV